jgi:hypothetical protein
VFAVAGSYFTKAGGPTITLIGRSAPFLGFQVGWVTWLVRATSLGALSSGLATYLGYFWPVAALGWQKQVIVTAVSSSCRCECFGRSFRCSSRESTDCGEVAPSLFSWESGSLR